LKIKLDDKTTVGIILVLIALFSFIYLGFTGFKVIFGMLFVFFLPFYLILDNFNISRSEKVIFSFFIGIGIFPALVYWLGVIISFKLAIAISFILFVSLGLILKKFKKQKKT
jgi:apolipoprotein N-acyltransferase